jgi:sugar (pentulose or hexulose) kinase
VTSEPALIGVDVGATSIKVGAFTPAGRQLALATRANRPRSQTAGAALGWMIWDVGELWSNAASALRETVAALAPGTTPTAVAVSGFGADGAPFTRSGTQRYPVISWHDARGTEQAARLEAALGAARVYSITGYHVYPINTLVRWRWLAENAPDSLEDATWLMVPDIVAHRLCGELRSDPTSASTTMAYSLSDEAWAVDVLREADIPDTLPPSLTEPGEPLGVVSASAAAQTGLPEGTPVVTGGHDCEVGALVAATRDAASFLDITGTWEMLLVERDVFDPADELFDGAIDWERHALPGTFLCQSLMPAGSVLNWLRQLLYPGDSWDALIAEVRGVRPGAGGVMLLPAFIAGMGPFAHRSLAGGLLGLRTATTRAQLVRAGFESLCFQLRQQVELLERAVDRRCESLRVLGGAQQNDFWLQLKADVTGRSVDAIEVDEATALGAALLAGAGAGVVASPREMHGVLELPLRRFEPSNERHAIYTELYETAFRKIPDALTEVSKSIGGVTS